MTHTIHPKMLEKVAKAICASGFCIKQNSCVDANGKNTPCQATADQLRLNYVWSAAEAAILAMWEGLPMEDAPKDKEIVILHNGQFLANVVMRHNVWMLRHSYPVIYTLLSPQPTRFYPIPTQETE